MYFFDPMYFIIIAPGLLLSLWASFKTKTTFSKYSKTPSQNNLTGAEAAREMLYQSGITGVTIERVKGSLTDHYDPRSTTLRLSESVYSERSLAAIGVACHEAGHALQHASGYAALGIRSALVPAANFGSSFSYIIIMIGMFMRSPGLMQLGCLLFGMAVLFSIITLPVEWNASSRAKVAMVEAGIITKQERKAAGKVLNAAFLTYLAAAVTSILTLLYYLLRSGLLGGGDD
ncbi:MAG: zinc metallopeptidase [Verrucomicrobiota bacterium]|nr:zinc metallopeptidase [Verrucomicrobiota bacterium]